MRYSQLNGSPVSLRPEILGEHAFAIVGMDGLAASPRGSTRSGSNPKIVSTCGLMYSFLPGSAADSM